MRVPIDPEGTSKGPFSELIRLQTEFYSRLADETLRYLHRLQGAAAPAVPGTVLMPDTSLELNASGYPGAPIELTLEIENRQRVHCMVTCMFSPMVDVSGVTWLPSAEVSPPSLLLAPDEVRMLNIQLPLPANIPPGVYHGVLLLQGFHRGAIAVGITVKDPDQIPVVQSSTPAAARSENSRQSRRRPAKEKAVKKRALPRTRKKP